MTSTGKTSIALYYFQVNSVPWVNGLRGARALNARHVAGSYPLRVQRISTMAGSGVHMHRHHCACNHRLHSFVRRGNVCVCCVGSQLSYIQQAAGNDPGQRTHFVWQTRRDLLASTPARSTKSKWQHSRLHLKDCCFFGSWKKSRAIFSSRMTPAGQRGDERPRETLVCSAGQMC